VNKIELSTHIQAPIERCFDLARSVELHRISMKANKEITIAGVQNGLLELNQKVLWQATFLGLRQNGKSKLTNLSAPYYFTLETESELMPHIIHDHFLYDIGMETIMIDHLYYKIPLGILGETANILFIKRYMTQLLQQRTETIREYAETEKWREILIEPKLELSIVC